MARGKAQSGLKDAGDELARARERLQLAMEASGVSTWETDLTTGETILSDGWAALVGGPRGETLTTVKDLMALVHPDDLEATRRRLIAAIKGLSEGYVEEHRVRTHAGDWRWVLSRGKVVARDASGRALRMVGTNVDISERKRAEASVQASEARYRTLLDLSPDIVILTDGRKILYANAAAHAALVRADLVGVETQSLVHPDSRPVVRARVQELLARPGIALPLIELTALAPDGRHIPVELASASYKEGDAVRILIVARDIRERKKRERSLAESEERLRAAAAAANFGIHDRCLRSGDFFISPRLKEILGHAPDADISHDMAMSHFHPDDQAIGIEAFARACDPAGDGRIEVTQRIVRTDGELRWLTLHGRIYFENGKPERSLGCWMDVTAQMRSRRLRELEIAVAQIFATKHQAADAMEAAMRAICEAEAWDGARYVAVDEANAVARSGPAWSVPDAAIKNYIEQSRGMTYTPGVGHIGRAWQLQETLWSNDIANDPRTARPQLAREAGLRSALVAPIIFEGTVFGILIFHSRRVRGPDEQLLQSLRVIGGQIGLYMKRSQAEAEMRRHERELRLVMDGVPSPVTHHDREERFVFVNRAYAELMERPAESIVGRRAREVISADNYAFIKPYIERVLAGESVHFLRPQQRADGSMRMLEVSYVPDIGEGGGVAGWFVFHLDVSEALAARQRLESINVELEETVSRRTEELRAVVKELEAYSYSVSHDLRSPIGAINSFAGLLRMNEAERLSEDGRRLLGFVESNAARMTELVEGLLAFSRIGQHELARRPVAMRTLVEACLAEPPVAAGAEITVGALPDCNGDASLLRQVWANLIGNALKYSRRSTPARVEIGFDAGAGGYFVRDNGVGFDMRHAGKLFGTFERLHSDAEFEGTGIGLATVQRIVQRHGGRVWANAMPGEGATFWFTVQG